MTPWSSDPFLYWMQYLWTSLITGFFLKWPYSNVFTAFILRCHLFTYVLVYRFFTGLCKEHHQYDGTALECFSRAIAPCRHALLSHDTKHLAAVLTEDILALHCLLPPPHCPWTFVLTQLFLRGLTVDQIRELIWLEQSSPTPPPPNKEWSWVSFLGLAHRVVSQLAVPKQLSRWHASTVQREGRNH